MTPHIPEKISFPHIGLFDPLSLMSWLKNDSSQSLIFLLEYRVLYKFCCSRRISDGSVICWPFSSISSVIVFSINVFFSSLQKYSEHFSPFSCQLARDLRSSPSIFCCRLFSNSNFLCTKEAWVTSSGEEFIIFSKFCISFSSVRYRLFSSLDFLILYVMEIDLIFIFNISKKVWSLHENITLRWSSTSPDK